MKQDDLTKPCSLFARELAFHKSIESSEHLNRFRYSHFAMDELASRNGAPVEIDIKVS